MEAFDTTTSRRRGPPGPGPPQRPDGVELAPDLVTLLGSTSLSVLPNLDADKNYIDDDIWLGAGGFDNFSTDCDGWTSSTGVGAIRPAATTRDHTFSQPVACSEQHRILCYAGPVVAVPIHRPAKGHSITKLPTLYDH